MFTSIHFRIYSTKFELVLVAEAVWSDDDIVLMCGLKGFNSDSLAVASDLRTSSRLEKFVKFSKSAR